MNDLVAVYVALKALSCDLDVKRSIALSTRCLVLKSKDKAATFITHLSKSVSALLGREGRRQRGGIALMES